MDNNSNSSNNEQQQQQTAVVVTAANIRALYREGRRDFRWANLWCADLSCADLSCADLTGANLRGANLRGANLTDANLRGADLTGANLTDANLRGANLTDANLRGADLTDANLRGANLTGADLWYADLTGADLTDANLRGADLTDANLRGADLTGANLQPIKDDLYGYLEHVPHEVTGLLAAMEAGKIDGSAYDGPCACLAGTCERLATEHDAAAAEMDILADLRNAYSPRERLFLRFRPGMTPQTDPVMATVAEWLREWIAAHPETETSTEGE